MTPSQSLAPRSATTLDTVQDILGALGVRYQSSPLPRFGSVLN